MTKVEAVLSQLTRLQYILGCDQKVRQKILAIRKSSGLFNFAICLDELVDYSI